MPATSPLPSDRARPMRKGEVPDIEALEAYLLHHLPELEAPLVIQQFWQGFSNLTYLVSSGERQWVLRRPPFGSTVRSAHDMSREHRILSRLHPVFPKVPRVVHLCEDVGVIGAPFYVMERLHGVILRRELPADCQLEAETVRRLDEAFVDTLVELHAVDVAAAGLETLGRPEGYVQRQVSGWTRRYQQARTDDLSQVVALYTWLDRHQPEERDATLIHNDYKFDNLVLDPADPARVLGVLDWEMATIGDPYMDVGTTLCYWVTDRDPEPVQAFRMGPTHLAGSFSRAELWERYLTGSGRPAVDPLFYFSFGLFKTAVVAQQIYRRYREGKTGDNRFRTMIDAVKALSGMALQAIEAGAVDG